MPNQDESVEVKGMGFWAKFSGPQVTCVAVLLMIGAFVAFLVYQHNAAATESMAAMTKAQDSVRGELQANRETTEAMLFVLWACGKPAPDKECDRMNLTKPKKLLEMQR